MQSTNAMRDSLITEFVENYMQKLFYFCLKKTDNNEEAEELTQDIAVNILEALNKGMIPTSFSAWVWQIARNRYAVWAEKKHRRNESVTGSDIGDYEIADERDSVLDELLRSEQMGLLRRELAFIKSEYRDLLVAYYIEDKSVREIADKLALSISAVQQRLHRARIQLKDGMDMAREFGKRSYNPENITFSASGAINYERPWPLVQRSIPKNILLQASNNPSTLEELSVELGIALPYMEEEVKLLYEGTLLEKCEDKYITNFFIWDKESRLEAYNILRSGAKERSRLIREFAEDSLEAVRGLCTGGAHLDDNTLRWWLFMNTVDALISVICKDDAPPKRSNGEEWGFVGYEDVELPEKVVSGHNGRGNGNCCFWTYQFGDYSLWTQCGEPDIDCVPFFADVMRKKRKVSSFSETEQMLWKKIGGKYAHADREGNVIPDVVVMTEKAMEKLVKMLKKHKNFKALLENCTDAYTRIEALIKRCNHKILYEQLDYYVHSAMYPMRMMALHDLVENGYLALPEKPDTSSLGMYLYLK